MNEACNIEKDGDGSVTDWLGQAKEGDSDAITNLCQRYFKMLAQVARSQFRDASRTIVDEEDIANSVLDTLFRNAAIGKFPDLHDRHELWSLLLAITNQKVISQLRHNLCEKRGSGRVFTMTDLRAQLRTEMESTLVTLPTQEAITSLSDLFSTLLSRLVDPVCRQIALLKLNGLSNREISKELDIFPRTVDRKIHVIRERWLTEFEAFAQDAQRPKPK